MRADQIQQIAAWLAATDIGLLELHGPGQTLLLHHDGAAVDIVETEASADQTALMRAVSAEPGPLTVSAPSVGVFLHRHPLRETALAAAGTAVRAGEPLGLLQIGALLLTVPAPQAGTVFELLSAHGAVVGYGTPLVSLHPATAS